MSQISLPQSSRQTNVPMQTPVQSTTNVQPSIVSTTAPLPLQQIITIIDSRLLFLEKFVSTAQTTQSLDPAVSAPDLEKLKSPKFDDEWNEKIQDIVADMLKDYIEEMDSRYEILATEILHLKNTLTSLKTYTIESLQTFTLDTDVSIMDERMRIINELSTMDVNSGNLEENIQTEFDEIADQMDGENHVSFSEVSGGIEQTEPTANNDMVVFA